MKCTVLGGGSWGTALGVQLVRVGHETVLWDRHPDRCDAINRDHKNPRYLKDVRLPDGLRATPDLADALAGADLVVPVVPSHALREVLVAARPAMVADPFVCCATKGIEDDTLATMWDVCRDVIGTDHGLSLLYGPSFALEVAQGLPTAVVVAGHERGTKVAAEAFHGELSGPTTPKTSSGSA